MPFKMNLSTVCTDIINTMQAINGISANLGVKVYDFSFVIMKMKDWMIRYMKASEKTIVKMIIAGNGIFCLSNDTGIKADITENIFTSPPAQIFSPYIKIAMIIADATWNKNIGSCDTPANMKYAVSAIIAPAAPIITAKFGIIPFLKSHREQYVPSTTSKLIKKLSI